MGSLSLSQKPPSWPVSEKMMTTGETFPSAEILEIIGIVDGVAEAGMSSVSVGRITLGQGGGLAELVASARAALAQGAGNAEQTP